MEVYFTCNIGAANCSFLPQTEKITEEVEVRLYSNIGMAQVDKGRNEENGVRVQVADPDLVVKKKALEKRMDRNPKAPLEEILKNNNLTGARVGVALPLWRPPAAELLVM